MFKNIDLSKIMIFQGIAFISLILLPSIIGKEVDLRIGYVGIEELLAIVLPFLWVLSVFISFNKISFRPKEKSFFYLLIIGIIFLILGQGVHLTGNFLNDHIFLEEGIVGKAKDAAYFYDEVLGHYLFLIGYLIIISAFLLEQYNYICLLYSHFKSLIFIGTLNGVAMAISVIEGQVVELTLIYSIIVLAIILRSDLKGGYKTRKFCLYYFEIVLLASTLSIILWGIINGGFPQFTEIGLF